MMNAPEMDLLEYHDIGEEMPEELSVAAINRLIRAETAVDTHPITVLHTVGYLDFGDKTGITGIRPIVDRREQIAEELDLDLEADDDDERYKDKVRVSIKALADVLKEDEFLRNIFLGWHYLRHQQMEGELNKPEHRIDFMEAVDEAKTRGLPVDMDRSARLISKLAVQPITLFNPTHLKEDGHYDIGLHLVRILDPDSKDLRYHEFTHAISGIAQEKGLNNGRSSTIDETDQSASHDPLLEAATQHVTHGLVNIAN
ncbi:MAG: hypothetical protein R3313_05285, partial [Candidatus Saccharimonadales bacterium]|nr:hypothetical protein [Candidatus Saccharimonadales bacterium]